MGKLTGIVLLVFLTSVSTFASQPGQPLDCSDWVSVAAGLWCEAFSNAPCESEYFCREFNLGREQRVFDNTGGLLMLVHPRKTTAQGTPVVCQASQSEFGVQRIDLWRHSRSGDELLGYFEDRCLEPDASGYHHAGASQFLESRGLGTPVSFDSVNGRLAVLLESRCANVDWVTCSNA